MFEHSEQASSVSEGINLATWHTWATKVTWVATFRDDYQRVPSGPLYPSVVFHMKTLMGSLCVARTLSHCHPWSTVGCCPTQRLSTLLSLWDNINPVCANTQLNAYCNRAQPTWSLIDTGGGYHLRSSEDENRPLSTFTSGILHFPLVASLGLIYSYKSDC
jgi:hypothetical protein